MKADRRVASRKVVDYIQIAELTSLSTYTVLAHEGAIIDASQSGFLLRISREQLVPKELRDNLNLDKMVGQQVVMFLPQMNLDLDGIVTRAQHVGRGDFEIAIQFSDEVPEYWRECLVELLPEPGELPVN